MAKRKTMSLFEQLKGSLEEVLAYRRGEPVNVRVTALPDTPRKVRPAEIRSIRRKLNVSQVRFATLLNVSPQAVRSWEQGSRRPRNAALKLLAIARKNPRVLLVA